MPEKGENGVWTRRRAQTMLPSTLASSGLAERLAVAQGCDVVTIIEMALRDYAELCPVGENLP
jgi:hypothetical protein